MTTPKEMGIDAPGPGEPSLLRLEAGVAGVLARKAAIGSVSTDRATETVTDVQASSSDSFIGAAKRHCPRTNLQENPGIGWFGKLSEAEQRKRNARLLYDFEVECRRPGWGDAAFVYDEEKDLFRWTDGRFAFSREHTDWALLRKRGRLRGWE
jgi:hypothetical protein